MKKIVCFSLVVFSIGCSAPSRLIGLNNEIARVTELSPEQLKNWYKMDVVDDSVPGISLEKAYSLVKDKKPDTVIVAVIDGGVDIQHNDLKSVIWVNKKEVPDNNVDDDGNGYTDDINGWNFIGGKSGNVAQATYEITRMANACMIDSVNSKNCQAIIQQFTNQLTRVNKQYTEEVNKNTSPDYIAYLEKQIRYYYNVDFNYRDIIGDDPSDITDSLYGNNDVDGNGKEEWHGTHVAGIIASIAGPVKLLSIRVVPDGDENDKDVATAIRYAVKQGAKVINMSFGKEYSMHADWVKDALRYAADNDVLIVNAAGNNSRNRDSLPTYPDDTDSNHVEYINNFICVGSITNHLDPALVSVFSNYGKKSVDIFAPGSDIYSCMPGNLYAFRNGTSMAAPVVSGVAALIRAYFPKFSASKVKSIILRSGMPYNDAVIIPGVGKIAPFSTFSVSGNIVNAYNAIVMAGL